MRLSAVVAILVTASVSSAEPHEGPTAEREGHLAYGVHLGYATMATDNNLGPAPSGDGPSVDADLAFRRPRVSVAWFASFYTLRAETDADDQTVDLRADARYKFLDVGGRASAHIGDSAGAFFGIGFADEIVHETGHASKCYCANNFCNPCNAVYEGLAYEQWSQSPFVEVHIGGTFPKIGPVAIEVLALAGLAFNPDDHGWFLWTKRIAIGARF